MPKSKRSRPVTLSKTKKKGRQHKEAIVNSIREAVEKYSSIYVFAFENMRNLKFKEFREQLKSNGRLFGEFEIHDFARTGSLATEKVWWSLFQTLWSVKKEKPLSPESARILCLLGMKLAVSKLHLICRWGSVADDFEVHREGLD